VRTLTRLLAAAASLAIPLAWAAPARADASSWMFFGGGAVALKQGTSIPDYAVSGALQIDVGVGTTPEAPFIAGGLFRLTPMFTSGVDMSLLARGATRGFQQGGFGVAFDAGGYLRVWGPGSVGFQGGLTIGAPLGLTLALVGSVGSDSARSFGAVAGIDFLRLTVYRKTMLDAWPNPLPSQELSSREGYGRVRF
jgi:hypothetical protein